MTSEITMHLRLLTLLPLVALTACASPMSTFQTGRTTPRNRVEVVTGMGANISSSFIGSVIDNGEMVADKVEQAANNGEVAALTEDETRDLMRSAFTYALLGPAPLWELGLRYGILDRWDAGIAYTTSGFRFETRVQLLKQQIEMGQVTGGDPLDLAIGVQLMRQVFEIPVPSFLKDAFKIEDFSRTDLTIPVVASRNFSNYGFIYGGPKFLYSFLQADVLEKVTELSGRKIAADKDMWAAGGVLGGGIGYKHVFFMLELNVLYYSYMATLLDTEVDLSGVNVYPAAGVKFNFFSL